MLFQGTNELTVLTFAGVFLLFSVGIAFGVLTLIFECLAYKYLVPCLRRRQWVNWLPYSQVSNVLNRVYHIIHKWCIDDRLNDKLNSLKWHSAVIFANVKIMVKYISQTFR